VCVCVRERERGRVETRRYLSIIGGAFNLGKEALVLTTWEMVRLKNGLLPQHGSSPAINHFFRFHLHVVLFKGSTCPYRDRCQARCHHCLTRLLHPAKRGSQRDAKHMENRSRLAPDEEVRKTKEGEGREGEQPERRRAIKTGGDAEEGRSERESEREPIEER
jgi:hypothetical protein